MEELSESLDEQSLLLTDDSSIQTTDDSKITIEQYDYEERVEYGNGMFIKLSDRNISAIAQMKFGK